MVDSADKRGANLWTVGCAITIQALVFYLFTFKLNEVDFIPPKTSLIEPSMAGFNKGDTAAIFTWKMNDFTGLIPGRLVPETFPDARFFKNRAHPFPPFSNSPLNVKYCKVKECSIWSASQILNKASLWGSFQLPHLHCNLLFIFTTSRVRTYGAVA